MGMSVSLQRFTISVCISLLASSAWACSCGEQNVDEVTHSKNIGLTKLKVNAPSITERVLSFFEIPTYSKSYSITVLEDYKGAFTASNITASTMDGETDCSRRVSYGEILYIITHNSSENYPSNRVSVCNTTSEQFAAAVKKEHENPSDAYKSVDVSKWTQLSKSSIQSFYADTKNVTKDVHGSYIWILMNDKSTKYKSHKTQIKISCKEKMYIVLSELMFSEFNANGEIEFAKNYEQKWVPLDNFYSKLMKFTC